MTLVFCICIAISLPAFPNQEQTVTCRRLSDDVLVFEENYWHGHLVAVNTGEGIVVIDTLPSPRLAREARAAIEKEFPNQPLRYVVFTDVHWDHNAGNQVFADCTIIGHANSVEKMRIDLAVISESFKKSLERKKQQLETLDPESEEAKILRHEIVLSAELAADMQDYVYTPPSVTLAGGATLKLGNKTLEIYYYGPAHTDSDFAVLVPEEALLITSDLVFNKATAIIDTERGGDAVNYVEALDKLMGLRDKVNHVVPGHGPVGDFQCVVDFCVYFRELMDATQDAMQRGLTLEQAKSEIKMEKYSHYEFYSESGIARSVEACWLSIEKTLPQKK